VSIAGAFGVGSQAFVGTVVGTLAGAIPEAQQKIEALIADVNFTGLGTVGASVLLVTTVLAISNVESALNDIWGVRQARSWGRRFPDYLAVIVAAPLLGGISISLSTTLRSQWMLTRLLEVPLFAFLFQIGLRQLPWMILSLVFAFLYWFLPNTRVRPLSALLGAVPAAILFMLAQGLYIDLQIGVVRANVFFGTFAALPLLFASLYVFWAIVLLGAEMAFAHQNLHFYRQEVRGSAADPAQREAIGLRIVLEVARRFRDELPALDAAGMSESLSVPVRTVRQVADQLLARNILSLRVLEGNEEGLQLGRPAERIGVWDVLGGLRGTRIPGTGDTAISTAVEALLSELEGEAVKGAGGRTVADLLASIPPAHPAPPGGPAA
jgi:membrane protein